LLPPCRWRARCNEVIVEMDCGCSLLAATMPLARTVQLYQFALFLKTHPLPTEETFEEIAADEAIWDTQFAATADDKLAALVAAVESEINEGIVLSMFDEHGEFIEHL